MRIGMALEEIFNPRMKRVSSGYKLFKSLNSSYIQEVFDSMNDEERPETDPGREGGQA